MVGLPPKISVELSVAGKGLQFQALRRMAATFGDIVSIVTGRYRPATMDSGRNRDNRGKKIMRTNIGTNLMVAFLTVCALAQPGFADEVADFYKDKTVSIVVGHQAGTGFDVYARVLQRHIGRHIPGNPSVIVQNMPGASGVIASNWLANIAPKDGTVFATAVYTIAFEPLFGNDRAKYDPMKFNWLGNLEQSVAICGVSKASGVNTFKDLQQRETIFGAAGATGAPSKLTHAIRHLAGAKSKLVTGYKGATDIKLAIARGEVEGFCGMPLSTLHSFWGDVYRSGEFKPIIQLSGAPNAELKGLPHIDSFAKTEEDRKVFGLVFGGQTLGRFFYAPPGVPPARVKALRDALMATMQDKEFLVDAERTKIDIDRMSGEEVEALVAKYLSVSPAIVARAKQVTSK
jgi:tripartite-type tricarboxylate transporter receptor subunit TctC